MRLVDADTGEQLVCVTGLEVVADCNDGPFGSVIANLTMLSNGDGQYLRRGESVVSDGSGGYLTTTERWDVAEMRLS